MGWTSISEIMAANARAGGHWFSGETMGFFRSEVYETIYGGRYFISSERMGSFARRYSVRRADSAGSIETMGHFDMFGTKREATAFAKKLATYPDGPRDYEVTERQRDGYLGRVCGPCTEMEAALITTYLNDHTNVYGVPEGGNIYSMAADRYARKEGAA